jgi:hypothetical protein
VWDLCWKPGWRVGPVLEAGVAAWWMDRCVGHVGKVDGHVRIVKRVDVPSGGLP